MYLACKDVLSEERKCDAWNYSSVMRVLLRLVRSETYSRYWDHYNCIERTDIVLIKESSEGSGMVICGKGFLELIQAAKPDMK